MPELPEVETVCRGLERELMKPSSVTAIRLSNKKLREPISKMLSKKLVGQTFTSVRRRAKYILLDTEAITVISHLGMSGSWRVEQGVDENMKHDHCRIRLADGRSLVYHDPRRFGLLLITSRGREQTSKWLKNLGVEPLAQEFNADLMQAKAESKTVSVKNFIMNQKIVVGVGNIYAVEALFQAHVLPQRMAKKVKPNEWLSIVAAIKKVLSDAIQHGGTTLKDYRQASGEMGEFQRELFVYGRSGEPCRVCRMKIKTMRQTGRSTFYCPSCQR